MYKSILVLAAFLGSNDALQINQRKQVVPQLIQQDPYMSDLDMVTNTTELGIEMAEGSAELAKALSNPAANT